MAESRLNIELFKKVRERIATVPESYNQNQWVKQSRRSPCGTVACLAGETIICAAPTIQDGIKELNNLIEHNDFEVPTRAAKLLGLRGNFWNLDGEETDIFLARGEGFPEPFRTKFRRAQRLNDKAAVVVSYLDHIITTGKVLE